MIFLFDYQLLFYIIVVIIIKIIMFHPFLVIV
jgi:hypothetical protein